MTHVTSSRASRTAGISFILIGIALPVLALLFGTLQIAIFMLMQTTYLVTLGILLLNGKLSAMGQGRSYEQMLRQERIGGMALLIVALLLGGLSLVLPVPEAHFWFRLGAVALLLVGIAMLRGFFTRLNQEG